MKIGAREGHTIFPISQRPPFGCYRKKEHLESEGDKGKIGGFESNAKETDEGGNQTAGKGGDQDGQEKRHAGKVFKDKGRHIGPNTKEGCMSKGEQAGISENKIKAHCEEGKDKNFGCQVDMEYRNDMREEQKKKADHSP